MASGTQFSPSPIRPLSAEVVARLRSTLTISSLSDAVAELLQNSLDAHARSVRININFSRSSCVVEDDGVGISPNDLPLIGTLNATSKYVSGAKISTFGYLGNALASLATHSILTLTTRPITHRSTSSVRFNYSPKPLSIGLALEHQRLQQAGTSVRVEGLFGDMPVRMKFNQSKLDEDKEWEEHKRVITSLLLIWVASNEAQAISVIVRDGGARKFIVKPRGTDSAEDRNGMYDHISKGRELQILHQVYSVQEIGPTSDWERVRARKGLISLDGWISTVGAPTKKYQFISLNHHPLHPPPYSVNVLHSELNRLFASSSFGVVDSEFDFDKASKSKKSIDRYPKCVLRIECLREVELGDVLALGGEGGTETARTGKGGVEGENLKAVISLLQRLVEQFLMAHNFSLRGTITTSTPLPGNNGRIPAITPGSAVRGSAFPLLRPTSSASTATAYLQGNRNRSQSTSPLTSTNARRTTPSTTSRRNTPSLSRSSSSLSSRAASPSPGLLSMEGWQSKVKVARKDPIEESGRWRVSPRFVFYKGKENIKGKGKEVVEVMGAGAMGEEATGEGSNQVGSKLPASSEIHSDSGTVSWKNPISNRTALIDARTGNARHLGPNGGTLGKRTFSIFNKVQDHLETTKVSMVATATAQSRLVLGLKRPRMDNGDPQKKSSWVTEVLDKYENPVFKASEKAIPVLGPTSTAFTSLLENCTTCASHYFATPNSMAGDRFKEAASLSSSKLSKESLKKARVIGQVDRKFILVKMEVENEKEDSTGDGGNAETLVVIDQHAADERCRVEALMKELCTPVDQPGLYDLDGGITHETRVNSRVKTVPTTPQLRYPISQPESELLKNERMMTEFAEWGILYHVSSSSTRSTPIATNMNTQTPVPAAVSSISILASSRNEPGTSRPPPRNKPNNTNKAEETHHLTITSLPRIVLDRCLTEPQIGIDLVRSHAWEVAESGYHHRTHEHITRSSEDDYGSEEDKDAIWLRRMGTCPRKLIDIINSRACRSAIMFNDPLSAGECEELVGRLGACMFGFQCAHGRPSMVPLLKLGVGFRVGRAGTGICEEKRSKLGVGYSFTRDGFYGDEVVEGPLGYQFPDTAFAGQDLEKKSGSEWGFRKAYREWKKRVEEEGEDEDEDEEVEAGVEAEVGDGEGE